MLAPHPHDEKTALKVVISSSAALGVMIWDFFWLLRDEVKYVWPNLGSSWNARIFIFTRYCGIASQIFNVYFTVRMYLGVHTSPSGCRIWFSYQALVVQVLLFFAEWLLLRRIYLLFLRSRLILVVLISFAVGQVASMAVSATLAFPSNKYTVTCMIVKGNPGSVFFSTTTMTIHMVIFFMTFWRYLQLPTRWTRTELSKVFMRDAAVSLSAIIIMLLFLTLSSLHVIKPTMSSNITYYWLVTIICMSIGRLILHYAKILPDEQVEDSSTWSGSLQLTSQIEMGTSLSVDTQLDMAIMAAATATATATITATATATATEDGQSPTLQPEASSSSMSMSKASQLSPSKWFGDVSPSIGTPSPVRSRSTMELAAEASLRRIWLAQVHAVSSDVVIAAPLQKEGEREREREKDPVTADLEGNPSLQPPSPEPPPDKGSP